MRAGWHTRRRACRRRARAQSEVRTILGRCNTIACAGSRVMVRPVSEGEDFGASFRGFLASVAAQAPDGEPEIRRRIREHFGRAPEQLVTVAADFPAIDQANVAIGLEAVLAASDMRSTLIGVTAEQEYTALTIAQLIAPARGGLMGSSGPMEAPVTYGDLEVGPDTTRTCIKRGLFFVHAGEVPVLVLLTGPASHDWRGAVHLEVMADGRAVIERILHAVRREARERSVYRRRVFSIEENEMRQESVRFHRLASVPRDQVVLPEGVLERIERLSHGVTRHGERLRAAGRHLRRGLLFHGPPGTGKTLTAMYLASQLEDRTVILMTGRGIGSLETACRMARQLQPAMVILEDVDLIAQSRENQSPGCAALLFELLNQMDGLGEDADVMFLLTTNNPSALESALTARPGRIDQAFSIPLPDENGRARLLELYARGLTLEVDDRAQWVARTAGATGAFIKELLRKAALFAAEEAEAIVVRDRHLDAALREMVSDDVLTRALVGAGTVRAS